MSGPFEPRRLALPAGIPDAEQPFVASPEVGGGRYANPWSATSERSMVDLLKWRTGRKAYKDQKRQPARTPAVDDAPALWRGLGGPLRIQWLGHASVLVQVDGVAVLIDPVFGRATVVPRVVPAPVPVPALPHIDAVLLSHGHRDHFDAPSISALAQRFPDALFATPSGLESALPAACRRRVGLSWWQEVSLGAAQLALVPAQHWHQRSPLDRNKRLWGGWVVRGRDSGRGAYHSGDTGYFGGFTTIGRVFPELDVAVLPLGAYEPRWFMADQHMGPEDAVRAFRDLGAKRFMGMHWGTFDLTDEPLDHGAFELLPAAVQDQDVDPGRVHVLAHGGGMSDLGAVGEAGVPGLGGAVSGS